MKFQLVSNFKQTGDQPQATQRLVQGLEKNEKFQTLMGVTGSGKTFTMANVIAQTQRPALVISHNKTLAAQLTSEFKEYFPHNAVHYFVSYYDYYQPEAYIPRTDTYIEKETSINEEIDRLRHACTQALLTREDVLIVASVSCIYSLGDPEDYQKARLSLKVGMKIKRLDILRHLTKLQYIRTNVDLGRGTFRARGEILEIFPSYEQSFYKMELDGDKIIKISLVEKLTQKTLYELDEIDIYPAKHFLTSPEKLELALQNIRAELEERVEFFLSQGKHLEAERIRQRTEFDLEMIASTGYCNGVENYSRQLSFRPAGQAPSTLIDYFPKNFLMFIDESHITIPQISGMYEGDKARKTILTEYGFRLPSALDNRPLNFMEFEDRINQAIFVSATPAPYEIEKSGPKNVVEQLIRPTGLVDPEIIIKPPKNQLQDLVSEIKKITAKGQRALLTTITKRIAEELSEYLKEEGIKTHYLHSDIDTFQRLEILRDLRLGLYDVVVGINLLREGLDLPEVSLVAILDADKEGFLRSQTSLIQIMGRASRHVEGRVIMYASSITKSMAMAIAEIDRRRKIQTEYNKTHGIIPKSIEKPVRDDRLAGVKLKKEETDIDFEKINPEEIPDIIKTLKNKMEIAVKNLEFEKAAILRDQIIALKKKRW